MHEVVILTRREFASYFATPLAFVFIVVFLLANAVAMFYLGAYFAIGHADLTSFFMFHPWLYLFFLPAISMRLWAEERRNGSIELLLTLPVPLWAIVLGKYAAALAFAGLALALTFPVWLTVNYLGAPDNGVILASYVGSLMLAGGYLAIGSCLSALTSHQVIAFVVSVVACFLFTVSGAPLVLELFQAWAPQALVETLASISLLTHFRAITGGVIDARDVVFFLSLIGVFLTATLIVVDMKKGEGAWLVAPRMAGRAPHGLALALLAVIFVSVNLAANISLRTARLDLTQNNLFTLSDGTRNILTRLDEPVTLSFYYSQKTAAERPAVRLFAQRVRDMLEEMSSRANGQVKLKIIDPHPFSEAEDQAVAQGLVARPLGNGEVIYFGLVGTNLVDNVEVIAYFADERQQYLEYDLARLIYNLAQPEKPVLGIMSNLPLDTGAGGVLAAMRGHSQPFLIYAELADRFEVEFIGPETVKIPHRVDVLLLAHPRPLKAYQAYAVDQFVMRGGRVIAFIDPQSEVSLTAGPNGAPLRGYSEQSNLPRLMTQWGVAMDETMILADRKRAQRVAAGRDARRALTDYILWMGYGAENVNRNDLITSNIDRLNLGTVGVLTPLDGATTTLTRLVSSSDEAGLMTRDYVLSAPTPEALQRRFRVDADAPYIIAARLSGTVATAFADGPPTTGNGTANSKGERANPQDHKAQVETANIIVFADSDFFDDRFWVSEQNYLGQRFGVPIADNGKFLLNAVENLMGSNDLISLRGRERTTRVFTRVEALRRAAEKTYRAEEEHLIARVEAAQAELDRLEQSGATLGDAQAAAKTHRRELLSARKALRRVQEGLRRDIEKLEARVTWVNIITMPLLVGLAAIGLAYRQRKRRLATQKAGGLIVGKKEPV